MKLMKVFDISEFSEDVARYVYENIGAQDYFEINLAGKGIPSLFIDELVEKGCLLDETILINS